MAMSSGDSSNIFPILQDKYGLTDRVISVGKDELVYHLSLRIDVLQAVINEFIESISLSFQSPMQYPLPNQYEIIFAPDFANTHRCQKLVLHYGVDPVNFHRILSLHYVSLPSFLGSLWTFTNSAASDLQHFTVSLTQQIVRQAVSQGILVHSGSSSSVAALHKPVYSPHYIDVHFLQDLQRIFSATMVAELQNQFALLDYDLKLLEKRCAKLMTLLKPIYQRIFVVDSSEEVWDVFLPKKKSLQEYPLIFSDSVYRHSLCDVDEAGLSDMLLAIKKHHMSTILLVPTYEQIQISLLPFCLNYLEQWKRCEMKVRLDRKQLANQDRWFQLNELRYHLFDYLHRRYQAVELGEPSSRSWMNEVRRFPIRDEENDVMARLTDQCRLINRYEPYLLALSNVQWNGQFGWLYLTCSHLYFQSTTPVSTWSTLSTAAMTSMIHSSHASIVATLKPAEQPWTAMDINLIPIRQIQELLVKDATHTVATIIADKDGPTSASAVSFVFAEIPPGQECLDILTASQQSYQVKFPTYPSDYARRIADVVDYLFQVSCLLLMAQQISCL